MNTPKIKKITPLTSIIVGAVFFTLAFLLTPWLNNHGFIYIVPAFGALTVLLAGILVLVLGLKVRQWNKYISSAQPTSGHSSTSRIKSSDKIPQPAPKKMIDPLMAARTAVYAQACILTGAILAGWHIGVTTRRLTILLETKNYITLGELTLIILLSLGLILLGFLVQKWCTLSPEQHLTEETTSP